MKAHSSGLAACSFHQFRILTPSKKFMSKKIIFTFFACMIGMVVVYAQQPAARKLDTTMKVGKYGYRVTCNNKSMTSNTLSVKPTGFEKEVNDFGMEVKGRVPNVETDDINRDGIPDLMIYIHANDSINSVNVFGVISESSSSLAPIALPDIYNDPKNRVGYKGHDVFFLFEGYLVRRFPVAAVEGAPPAAASGNLYRQMMYTPSKDENGRYLFKVTRVYDFTKQ